MAPDNGCVNSIPEYQTRVHEEAKDLDEKITKLTSFLDGDMAHTTAEYKRLHQQKLAMQLYYSILEERINNF